MLETVPSSDHDSAPMVWELRIGPADRVDRPTRGDGGDDQGLARFFGGGDTARLC